jgi:TolB-like protein/Flp pilus assembly protein TadD
MSPEQARGRELDVRSDVFAYGVVLYEMATGCAPFTGRSPSEVIEAVLSHHPVPPSRVRPDLPDALDGVILEALEKHRDARLQSMGEAMARLRRLQSEPRHPALPAPAKAERGRDREGTGRIGSLAVIPLQALSTGGDQELLADGMTDALIAHLSRVRSLRVISRTSVLRYKGRTKPVPQIAAELGVDAVVEGAVLLSGGRVRVTARLIHAARDHTLWSRTYERELRDVLALQSELARAVTRGIRVALTPDEEDRLVRARPVDPEAHFAFLRGQFHASKGGPADLQKALREYQAALERDPTFAPAWAGIGWAYTWLAGAAYGALPPRDAMPLAKSAAERALEAEPSAAAHAILGYVAERYEYDRARAGEEFERALDLDPGSAAARQALAEHLTNLGRFDEAIGEATTALALDPFSLNTRTNLALRYYFARRFEEAARVSRQTLELEPGFPHSRVVLGLSLLECGQGARAVAELERLRARRPADPLGLASVAFCRARQGETATARALLRELTEARRQHYVGADCIALVHMGIGHREGALEWLETAYEERAPGLVQLGVMPPADGLRSHPRFRDLVRRIGLPSADLRPQHARHEAGAGPTVLAD